MICAIMIGGAFLPAVSTAGSLSVVNDSGTLSAVEPDTDLTANLSIENNDYVWTVNGVVQSDFTIKSGTQTFIVAENMGLYVDHTATLSTFFVGKDNSNSIFYQNNISSVDISITNKVATVVITAGETSQTRTITNDWMYYGADNGEYRLITTQANTNITAYYSDLNDIKTANYIWSTGAWYSGDGEKITVTTTSDSFDITPVVKSQKLGEGVYKMNMSRDTSDRYLSFDVPNGDSTYTLTPISIVLPYKIDGHVLGYTDPVGAMFGVLPIIAIAGLVMVGIYVFISRK